jgi:hypothetical protein
MSVGQERVDPVLGRHDVSDDERQAERASEGVAVRHRERPSDVEAGGDQDRVLRR